MGASAMLMHGPLFRALVWRCAALAAAGLALAGAAALDELGRLLISVHMIQHLLLSTVAPLLIVLARPWSLIGPLLSPARRRAVRGAVRASGIAALTRFATHPLVAWLAFAGSFIVWHLPAPYQWTLQTAGAHAFAAATFFLAG